MLTPGIEYFGAASDHDAVAFGEGRLTEAVPFVRADGIAPDGRMAIVGSLLAGMTMDAVTDPTRLLELDVERRPDGTIQIVRLPVEVSDALRTSTPDLRSRVAQRMQGYVGISDEEVIAAATFLGFLVELLQGAGQLYARVITVEPPRVGSRRRPSRENVITLVLVAAVAVVLGTLAFSVPALAAASPIAFVALALVLIGAFAAPVIATVKDSRESRTVARLGREHRGSAILRIAVTEAFHASLSDSLPLIDGVTSWASHEAPNVRTAYLVVNPSGLDLKLGGRERLIHLPRSSVVDAQLGYAPTGLRTLGLLGPALALTVRSQDQREFVWVLPLKQAGTTVSSNVAVHILVLVRSALGL